MLALRASFAWSRRSPAIEPEVSTTSITALVPVTADAGEVKLIARTGRTAKIMQAAWPTEFSLKRPIRGGANGCSYRVRPDLRPVTRADSWTLRTLDAKSGPL